jgi:hypothetical protein
MNTTSWLEQNVKGFEAIPQDTREAVMQFAFLWSLFEYEAMGRHANPNTLTLIG